MEWPRLSLIHVQLGAKSVFNSRRFGVKSVFNSVLKSRTKRSWKRVRNVEAIAINCSQNGLDMVPRTWSSTCQNYLRLGAKTVLNSLTKWQEVSSKFSEKKSQNRNDCKLSFCLQTFTSASSKLALVLQSVNEDFDIGLHVNPCGFKFLNFHSFIIALENSCSKINITFTGLPKKSKIFY